MTIPTPEAVAAGFADWRRSRAGQPNPMLLRAARATARKGLDKADCTDIHNHTQLIEAFTYLRYALGRLMAVLDTERGDPQC